MWKSLAPKSIFSLTSVFRFSLLISQRCSVLNYSASPLPELLLWGLLTSWFAFFPVLATLLHPLSTTRPSVPFVLVWAAGEVAAPASFLVLLLTT